jgi:putative redox protein
MADMLPSMTLDLTWAGDQRFAGRSGDLGLVIDGHKQVGVSPMQLLAYGLAGCMSIDVANIVVKGRHPLKSLRTHLTGYRAQSRPSRFTGFDLHYVVVGNVPPEAVERAIQLSRDTYCSAWHSLRQDIELKTSFEILPE